MILILQKIFVMGLFKMKANQTKCSRLEQRSIFKFLVAEKCKPCEIYRKMSDVYGEETCFSKKYLYKWVKHRLDHYEAESKKQSIEWKH